MASSELNVLHLTETTVASQSNRKSVKRKSTHDKSKPQASEASAVKNSTRTIKSEFKAHPGPGSPKENDLTNEALDARLESPKLESVNPQPTLTKKPPLLLLSSQYDLTTMSILSSTKINKKVVQALNVLALSSVTDGARERVVMLYATSKACSKMISIVEIVKREIAKKMLGKWFQYNTLHQEAKDGGTSEEIKINAVKNQVDIEMTTEAAKDSQTPFEKAIEGTPKVQTSIVMSIYLSRFRVESLKKKLGEQTNE